MLKKISFLTILSALLLTFAGCIIDPPPPPPPYKSNYSIIEGYITDIDGPVANVKVSINIPTKSRVSPAPPPKLAYETTTDSKGYFKADSMAEETFTLKAEKVGYNSVSYNDITTLRGETTIKNITLTKSSTP